MEQKYSSNNEFAGFRKLIISYLKNWYLFVISVGVALSIALIYIKTTDPVYEILANLYIKDDSETPSSMGANPMQNFSMGNIFGSSTDIVDDVHFITSNTALTEAVKELDLNKSYLLTSWLTEKDLYTKTPLEITTAEHIQDTLSVTLLFEVEVAEGGGVAVEVSEDNDPLTTASASSLPLTVETIYGAFQIQKTPHFQSGKEFDMEISISGYSLMAEYLSEEVISQPYSKESNIINLSMEEVNIARGKELLNTLIRIFNKNAIYEKNLMAESTDKFLTERLDVITKDLNEIEVRLEQYKKDNKIANVEIEAEIMLQQNGEFKLKLIEAETQYAIIEYTEKFISDPANQYALIPFTSALTPEETSTDAVQLYNDALLKRLALLRTTHENSPSVLQLNEQIEAMRINVLQTIANLKGSLNIARRDLQAMEDKFMQKLNDIPTQEREYVEIKRQQEIKSELYIFLMQRKEENALTLAVTTPKGQIMDNAYHLSEPVKPRKLLIVAIAFVLGLVIPIIYLYLREVFRTKFSSKKELEELTHYPILGEVCINKTNEKVVVHEGDVSPITELFRLIRSNMQFMLTDPKEKVILITSSVSGEGKSFFSNNFALSLALSNKRTILVGLDIRSPKLAEYLGISSRAGITNYLASSDLPEEDIIVKSKTNNNLDIILSGPVPPNPSELLLSKRLDQLFIYLREHYDYIVVDSAPVGMVSDSFTLVRISDATIYLCRANYTHRDHIRYANDLIAHERLRKASFVINGTTGTQGYGYGYDHANAQKRKK